MRTRYYILTFAYCAAIFYLSSRSKPVPIDMPFPGLDKVVHALLYGGLCSIVSVGIHRSNTSVSLLVQLLIPIAFTVCYGVTDELHQLFVPNRSFEAADLVADAVGALLAQALLFLWWRRKKPLPILDP